MIYAEDVLTAFGGGADATTSTAATLGLDGGGSAWQTSAGSTIVIMVVGTAGTTVSSSGFTSDSSAGGEVTTLRKTATAGETSWTLTANSTTDLRWIAAEFPAGTFDSTYPVDQVTDANWQTATTSLDVTVSTTAYEGAVLVFLVFTDPGAHDPATWTADYSRYTILYQFQQGDYGVALALRTTTGILSSQVQTFGLSKARVLPGNAKAAYAAYAAEGSRRVAAPLWSHGGELVGLPSTAWANTGGVLAGALFTDVTGTPTFTATGRTSGTGCLRVSATTAIQYVHKNIYLLSGGVGFYEFVLRFCVIFEGSLPSADVTFAEFATVNTGITAAETLTFTYRSATQKIGLRFGTTDTEILSSATVAADTWIGIDFGVDARTTAFKCRWSLDYNAAVTDYTGPVAQTTVTHTSPAAGGTTWDLYFGWRAAKTATIRFDDIVAADMAARGQYPMGDMRVLPILLDPAATPTVVGTVGDFAAVTGNATGTTLTSGTTTTARDNLRSLVWGASQAGVCQINIGATDRLRFPLTATDQADLPGLFRGLMFVVAGWAASTTAATIRVGYYTTSDGEMYLVGSSSAAVDPNWDNSTTVQSVIVFGMIKPGDLAGLTANPGTVSMWLGGSGDATPDIGALLLMADAVYQASTRYLVFDQGGIQVVAWEDPYSHAIVAYDLTAPAGGPARATYTISGSPVNHDAAAGTTTRYKISAATAEAVSFLTAGPN